MLNYLTLRLIPSPQLDQPPTLVELLETHWSIDCQRNVDGSRLVSAHRRLGARPAALGSGRRAESPAN